MTDERNKPTPLGGLWAFLVGGVLMAGTLVAMHPDLSEKGCSNYGGNGNGTVFEDEAWGYYLVFMAAGWIVLILLEQFLPSSWRHRDSWWFWSQAVGVPVVAATLSCCVLGPLLVMCH